MINRTVCTLVFPLALNLGIATVLLGRPCDTIQRSPQAGDGLVSLGLKNALPIGPERPFIWTGDATSTLYFQLFRNSPPKDPPMRVVVAAKTPNSNDFDEVCDTGWSEVPVSLAVFYRANVGVTGRVTWRITIYDPRNLSGLGNVESIKLTVFRENNQTLFPPGTVSAQSTNSPFARGDRGNGRTVTPVLPTQARTPGTARAPLDLLCWQSDGGRLGQRTPGLPSVFSNASSLVVQVDDRRLPMSQPARRAVAENLAEVMALWRLVCLGCGPYNVSLIRLDHEVYMDSVLADWFGRCTFIGMSRPGAPFSPPGLNGEMTCEDADVMLSARVGGRGVTKEYVAVGPNHTAIQRLCAEADARLIREFQTMKRVACGGDLPVGQTDLARLTIQLTGSETNCGSVKNIVACAGVDGLVQLNADDWRFVIQGAGYFGKGADDVSFIHVLAHESGHWLGLRHLNDDPNDIMAMTLADRPCITNTTVQVLSHVVDLKDASRLGSYGALYRAHRSQ